jgi:polar amino acid transport system substrate-binding protein
MTARRLLVALLFVCVLAGCSSVSERAQISSLAAINTREPDPRGQPYPDLEPTKSCQQRPLQSLPALKTLPPPGRMPPKTPMARIQAQGHLNVGADQNSLRLSYFNPLRPDKDVQGFDADLARAVARAIFGDDGPDRIRFRAISTGQRVSAIVERKVDIVASAFSITCARRRRMHFSDVYHTARQRLLVPSNSTVSTLDDLKGHTVCTTATSTSGARLDNTGVRALRVRLRSDCLAALQEGEADAMTSDDAILFGLSEQDPQTKIVGPTMNCERWGIAIRLDEPELVRFVNAVLARMRRNGTLRTLRTKWFAGIPQPKGGVSC